ncbi:squalene/phytoene synthase family protein [Salinithrix halophila]|uniref:Squalene/phytoene synthase family protein n=1 Tax=Salinithrix halophila TaxID=1485204 RepID=A0ABV8JAE4_9BACL
MDKIINRHQEASAMLKATSRTFFIPISRLPEGLKEAVSSAYLCMRAIDEIEDDPALPSDVKANLLRSSQRILQQPEADLDRQWTNLMEPHRSRLPEVTLRMNDWAKLSPPTVRSLVYDKTGIMAKGMADWVCKEWDIRTEEDLDDYTYYVAGLVGVLLNDLWRWYDGTETDEKLAVAYGRGLQAVNIIRNREEDLARGVDFFPNGWSMEEMFSYARRNLVMADIYTDSIQSQPILEFCKIPLTLAHGTLRALEAGESKLSRFAVKALVKKIIGE